MRMEASARLISVRPPAVAGQFYPSEPARLRAVVDGLLSAARRDSASSWPGASTPKALIVPHAGYEYSGPVAARAYARIARRAQRISRVVLVGPAHRIGFYGIAAPECDLFETPLGRIRLDQDGLEDACALPTAFRYDAAHAPEHSLEVQLPFLQRALGDGFSLVPLVVGGATGEEVGRVLERCWGGPETLVVVSSDLSHHLDYDTSREVDERTARAIEALDGEPIGPGLACGRLPIQGLLHAARLFGLKARRLDLKSSGDTVGPRERVVGYGAFEFS